MMDLKLILIYSRSLPFFENPPIRINRYGDIAPMKRSVRPFFSLLFLIVFTATLGCRIVTRRNFSSITDRNVFARLPTPNFNATLLKYAAIDVGEEKSKQEIDQLLQADFRSQGRYRAFATWIKANHHDPGRKSSTGLPVTLRSPKFYQHWIAFRRNLQDWARKKTYRPDVMLDLVRSVKHPIDEHNGVPVGLMENRRYSSCAVVGNSGILLNSEHGELIDSHDIVIRLNNARTDRFEQNVGSKTDLSFVNSNILHLCAKREGCFCHPYGSNVPMVVYICQPTHLMDYTVCSSSHKPPLLLTDPKFDLLCGRVAKYYSLKRFAEKTGKSLEEWGLVHDAAMFHYSSGMQAVMLALGICDNVSIFGFGKSVAAKHHYHTNQIVELRLHDYEAEYAFYGDLVKNRSAIPFMSKEFRFPSVVMYR